MIKALNLSRTVILLYWYLIIHNPFFDNTDVVEAFLVLDVIRIQQIQQIQQRLRLPFCTICTTTTCNPKQQQQQQSQPLFAVKKRAQGSRIGGGKTKNSAQSYKKKKKNNNTRGDNNKNTSSTRQQGKGRDSLDFKSSTTEISNKKKINDNKPSSTQKPPWQVLNTKEAKKNVQKEIQRRELIKAGKIKTDEDIIINDDNNTDNNNNNNKSKTIISTNFLHPSESQLIKWRRFNPTKSNSKLEFIGAYLDKQIPERMGVPEIAFLGRSNVGKSSLLNTLSSSKQARVGKTPGATASVNLYVLQQQLSKNNNKNLIGFVDLPGFGYAKLSKDIKDNVQKSAENYLNNRTELALGILLVDIRRVPSDNDRAVLAALYDKGISIVVIATKIDKISINERQKQLNIIQKELGLPIGQPLAISSITNEGCNELWKIILDACEIHVNEFKSKYNNVEEEEIIIIEEEIIPNEEEYFNDDDDDDDFVYNQGYDWIHNNNDFNIIEDDYYDNENDNNMEYYDDDDDDFYNDINNNNMQSSSSSETLKSLKKKARNLERNGEL